MSIKRRHVPVLVVAGITVGIGLALLLALFVGVGLARADTPDCGTAPNGASYCCEGDIYSGQCWGPAVWDYFGCERVGFYQVCPEVEPAVATSTAVNGDSVARTRCYTASFCFESTGGTIWLADVCEPNDGFSADGGMTWDSNHPGPLQFAASMEGPWVEVQVNGPPWVVTEENMEAFAAMVGVEDWHDMWVRSGEGYPRHVGNTVMERDARMDELCAE
jgi:hypothetical protein